MNMYKYLNYCIKHKNFVGTLGTLEILISGFNNPHIDHCV